MSKFSPLLLSLGLVIGLTTAPAFAKPVPYAINAKHTQVLFSYNHHGFANITNRFMQVSGEFVLDSDDLTRSSINVSLPIDGLSTGVPGLDDDLKSPNFFDAAKFPTATFKSTGVKLVDKDKLKVSGELTIHGVTKPVVLDVTVNKIGPDAMSQTPSAGFDASVTLKRSDFGMGKYVPVVSDQVRLQITLEAAQAQP